MGVYFSSVFLNYISHVHFSSAFLKCISQVHFLRAFLWCISQVHFSSVFLKCISQVHFPSAFLMYASINFNKCKKGAVHILACEIFFLIFIRALIVSPNLIWLELAWL